MPARASSGVAHISALSHTEPSSTQGSTTR